MSEKLLPCPFCGEIPEVVDDYNVICKGFLCPMNEKKVYWETWNRRHSEPSAPVEETEALKYLADKSYGLVPENIPTGGDDFDIEWRVVSYHMGEPKERTVGRGKTPAEAIRSARLEGRRRLHRSGQGL